MRRSRLKPRHPPDALHDQRVAIDHPRDELGVDTGTGRGEEHQDEGKTCEEVARVRENLLGLTGERLGSDPSAPGMCQMIVRFSQWLPAWTADGTGRSLGESASRAAAPVASGDLGERERQDLQRQPVAGRVRSVIRLAGRSMA
jgi:hypothetical protein